MAGLGPLSSATSPITPPALCLAGPHQVWAEMNWPPITPQARLPLVPNPI